MPLKESALTQSINSEVPGFLRRLRMERISSKAEMHFDYLSQHGLVREINVMKDTAP